MTKKKKMISQMRDDVNQLYYNKGLDIKKIAEIIDKSPRTIYRWLNQKKNPVDIDPHFLKPKQIRSKRYPPEIFERIKQLKQELPIRSSVTIRRLLQMEFKSKIPSLSTIRKYLAGEGYSGKDIKNREGYIVFERSKPNDLWQIDIAGVQTVGHLGPLHLFALIDDCSRFIPAAFYAKDEKAVHVIELLKQAIIRYGKPNQILADNGTQFKNILGELGTRYARLLTTIGITPIFAKPHHPQTKGKLERWFGTVIQMFLSEARHNVKEHPEINLVQFNNMLMNWIDWYNSEKSHRSLPGKCSPSSIYFNKQPRIYRPLEIKVDWDRWMAETARRKVTKTNFISYDGALLSVPPGCMGMNVDVLRFPDRIECYYGDKFLISHPLAPFLKKDVEKRITRRIAHNGTIGFKGTYYSVDYRLRGEVVEVQVSNDGITLLIYLKDRLIKSIPLKNTNS